jgi:hypothetical protein
MALTVLTVLFMAFGSLISSSPAFIDSAVADDGKAALKFAPKSTTGVIAVNIDRVKSSPAYKAFIKVASADPEFNQILKVAQTEFGLDLEKDVSSVVIILPNNVQEEQFVVIANGKFDQKKISSVATEAGGKAITIAGQAAIESPGDNVAFAFVGSHALLGTKPTLTAALSDGGAAPAGITKLIGAVDTGKDVWVAVELPPALKKLDPNLETIKSLTASLDLSSGVGLKLAVDTTSADKAKELVAMANMGLAAAAKDPGVEAMGLAAAVGRTKISNSGTTINVDISVTAAELETIQQVLGAFMP